MNPLYDAIFHRKSVRKLSPDPLPGETLTALLEFAAGSRRLHPEIEIDFALLGAGEIGGRFAIDAPHYLCLYSAGGTGSLQNAGFVLQQIDLYLSSQGIGSCYLGASKPKEERFLTRGALVFVTMLALGAPLEPVHREVAGFKRKSLGQITDLQDAGRLLEPVRLAPSAMNSQPWRLCAAEEGLLVCREKLGTVRRRLLDRLNQIDTGIALCHLALSCEAQGKTVAFSFEERPAPEGYLFEACARISGEETPVPEEGER